jgi:hypothetical protein
VIPLLDVSTLLNAVMIMMNVLMTIVISKKDAPTQK